MQHRGTARRRIIQATGDGLTAGAEIVADGRPLGTLGSVAGDAGLALVRLDRAKDALDAGKPITAGERPLALALPGFARFTWPAAASGDG
jgi:folate-binding Fe-S cluster repair protein YgfZ